MVSRKLLGEHIVLASLILATGCRIHATHILVQNQRKEDVEFQWVCPEQNAIMTASMEGRASTTIEAPYRYAPGEYLDIDWRSEDAYLRAVGSESGKQVSKKWKELYEDIPYLVDEYRMKKWDKNRIRLIITDSDIVWVLEEKKVLEATTTYAPLE